MVLLAGRAAFEMALGRRTTVWRLSREELLSRHPDQPNVRYALGAYIAPDDPEAAIAEFRRELARTPDLPPALLQIAQIETSRGKGAAAVPLAEQAVRLVPELPV